MYIKIDENKKVCPVNFASDIDPRLAIQKIKRNEPEVQIIEYQKELPEGLPVEGWIWDEENEEITIDSTLFPVGWAGILADLVGMDVRIKMILGYEYLILYQAALEANQAYTAQELITVHQKLSDADWLIVSSIYDLHFFPMQTLDLDEPPF